MKGRPKEEIEDSGFPNQFQKRIESLQSIRKWITYSETLSHLGQMGEIGTPLWARVSLTKILLCKYWHSTYFGSLFVESWDKKKEEKIVYLLKGETKNRFKSFLFRWFSLEKRTHTHIKMGNMYVIIIKGCST